MRKLNEQKRQKTFPELDAFIKTDAREWSVATYLAAKRLMISLRTAGVNEPDYKLKFLARQLDLYDDRTAFDVAAS